MDVYKRLAEYYDLIYCDRLDLDFYLMEAKNTSGPVLEAACGTGRILLRLLSEGIPAVGIDISKSMLDVLIKKAHEMNLKPEIHVANITDFNLGKKFGLIIVPYRSFLHLKNDEERKNALNCFMRHLKDSGRLILHTYNISDEERNMTKVYHLLESEDLISPKGRPYNLKWYFRYNPKKQQGSYKIVIELNGNKETFQMDIYYISVKKMRQLLSSAGFRNIRSYCGFDYSPFEKDCSEVVWIAEK